jgi:AraC-like DNA-binding protein
LDQIVSENPAQAPSLSQVADHLGCGLSTLQRQFPEQSSLVVARYRAYREQEHAAAREALEAALANEQQPPLLPIQVARQLGYSNHYYVITFFPDLCHQLFQRYEAHRRQVMQAQLEAVLAEPSSEPPPALGTISRQLGYTSASLKHFHPDLCQAIEVRYQTYWAEKKREIEACLGAILTGDRTPPLSVKAVGRELELPPDAIRRYFPELAAAVSARFKRYVRERAEYRRLQLDEEVKQITRQLFQAGIEPKLHRVISRLSVPGAANAPHVRQAWQAARKELGLPT